MWKEYSKSFLKSNRASSISILIASFIASLFLSLICGLFYNFWVDEVERIVIEEGDWQGRISGIQEADLTVIEQFANVERAELNSSLSEDGVLTADLWFQNKRAIYRDIPLLLEKLGLETSAASYHELLLSRYLIHDPQDPEPPLLVSFFLVLLLLVSASLILIIHNSFAVSMDARIHQFGILSSVGATPRQILICLMQEAAALSLLPILLGCLLGIAGSAGILWLINAFAADVAGRHQAVFQYHPLVLCLTLLASLLTVLISAYLPARKLSRLTPLQAIRGTDEVHPKKGKRFFPLSLLFGIEGELAGNALRAQKKALRTSTLSLTLSFLSFSIMLCFFTLAGISTSHTYFERYQDCWDVMATLKHTKIEDIQNGDELRRIPGVTSAVIYQKDEALCPLPESELSEELLRSGGLAALSKSISLENGVYSVKAPIMILDDAAFEEYCRQLGIEPETNGAILLNRIWDSQNSNFRYKEYIPFVKEDASFIPMQNMNDPENTIQVPVLAYTVITPVLREEYENYGLVTFLPLSLWKQISSRIGSKTSDAYIRILGKEGVSLDELNQIQKELSRLLLSSENIEIENRIQEKITDQTLRTGSQIILGSFCVLLAVIGIANVFSNTMGFLRQRKREFARYASIGMTPESMKKMFFIEAFVIAGRPLFITLPLTALAVTFMIRASYLDPMEFIEKAPLIPILLFSMAIFGFVGLAYYIGGKRILRCDLKEALQNDAMM